MLFLAQTDTTAGFLSKDFRKINAAKKRDLLTPCILTAASFAEILAFKNDFRTPKKHRNFIRKARKTSFILPNFFSFRVVRNHPHEAFLRKFGAFYSSSANLHEKKFDANLARKIVLENGGKIINSEIFDGPSSRILKINRAKKRKIR